MRSPDDARAQDGHLPQGLLLGGMNRADRRRAARLAARVPVTEPQAAPQASPGILEASMMHREMLNGIRKVEGPDAGDRNALATMIGMFAYLVDHHGIEDAEARIKGALSDMVSQALLKRAKDIQAGRRPPMPTGEGTR